MDDLRVASAASRLANGDEGDIRRVLDAFPHYVLLVDSDHRIVISNRTLYDQYGLVPEVVLGNFCPKVIHGLDCAYEGCPVEEADATGVSVERELFDEPTQCWMLSAAYITDFRTVDDKSVYLHVVQDITEKKHADAALQALRSSLEETVALRTQELEAANRELQHEILERRRAEETIRRLAYFDTLTGLPNRANFSELLATQIAAAQRDGARLGVALLDLDGFKTVNDTMGHDAGDALLTVVGRRLREATRDNDTAARMGGDEFLFIFNEIDRPEDVDAIAQRLLDALAEPFSVNGTAFQLTASVGGAVYPDDGADEIALMKRADLAMYAAKRLGGSRFCRAAECDE
jgi:diguanylate cyclase (GGDEF)-like protein